MTIKELKQKNITSVLGDKGIKEATVEEIKQIIIAFLIEEAKDIESCNPLSLKQSLHLIFS
jgi:hypothetical protein